LSNNGSFGAQLRKVSPPLIFFKTGWALVSTWVEPREGKISERVICKIAHQNVYVTIVKLTHLQSNSKQLIPHNDIWQTLFTRLPKHTQILTPAHHFDNWLLLIGGPKYLPPSHPGLGRRTVDGAAEPSSLSCGWTTTGHRVSLIISSVNPLHTTLINKYPQFIKAPCFYFLFSLVFLGGLRGSRIFFFHFSLVPNVFPLCSLQVPNVFPNMFSIAPHFWLPSKFYFFISLFWQISLFDWSITRKFWKLLKTLTPNI